jgi:integrase
MARRGNGEGTICQRKDGRWCAAVYVLLPNGGEKRMFVYGRTREDVHAKLVELQEKRRRNVPVVPRSLKLGDYLDYWLAQVVRPGVRWNTYKKYEQTVRLYLKPGLGRKPLDRVRVADLQAFLNQQIEAGHSIAKVHSGQPVEPRNLVRSFERLVDRAGLRQIRLHDLRHTVATLLKTLRVPQRDAMQILGHARISVTLEIYTDSDSDSQRDALTRMSDRLFGQAGT